MKKTLSVSSGNSTPATATSSSGDLTEFSYTPEMSQRSVSFSDLRHKWSEKSRRAWMPKELDNTPDEDKIRLRKRSSTMANLSGSSPELTAYSNNTRKRYVKRVRENEGTDEEDVKEDLADKLEEEESDGGKSPKSCDSSVVIVNP